MSEAKIIQALKNLVDYDYSVRPLKKGGPAQEVRDLGPKLEPREPSKEGKSKKKNRIKEFMKTHPGYKDATE